MSDLERIRAELAESDTKIRALEIEIAVDEAARRAVAQATPRRDPMDYTLHELSELLRTNPVEGQRVLDARHAKRADR